MKMLTHNLIMCNKKGCTINNYPLSIKCTKQAINKFEFDPELVTRTIKKIDLAALTKAGRDMECYKCDLDQLSGEELHTKEVLEFINHLLFEIVLEEGALICNNCAKEYKVSDGIPNMVLNDEEV